MGTGSSRYIKCKTGKSSNKPGNSSQDADVKLESLTSLELCGSIHRSRTHNGTEHKIRKDNGESVRRHSVDLESITRTGPRLISNNGDFCVSGETRPENDVIVEDIEGYALYRTNGRLVSNSNNSSTHELRLFRSRIPVLIKQTKFSHRVQPSKRQKGFNNKLVCRGRACLISTSERNCGPGIKKPTDDKQSLSPVKHPGFGENESLLIEELQRQGIIESASRAKSKAIIRELLQVGLVRDGIAQKKYGDSPTEVKVGSKRDKLPPLEMDTTVAPCDAEIGDINDGNNVDVRFLRDIKLKVRKKETEKLKVKMLDLDLL